MREFGSRFSFDFARWIHRENISKNGIDRLLKQPGLESLVEQLGWDSANDLREKMEKIPTVADIGQWKYTTVDVPSDNSLNGNKTYTLRYRDPVRAIRFFLGHPGFKDDLCYEPYTDVSSGRYRNPLLGRLD